MDDRSRTTLSQSEATLGIRIEAADLIALRAAINTWCSLLSVAESVGAMEPGGSAE